MTLYQVYDTLRNHTIRFSRIKLHYELLLIFYEFSRVPNSTCVYSNRLSQREPKLASSSLQSKYPLLLYRKSHWSKLNFETSDRLNLSFWKVTPHWLAPSS